MPTDDKYFPYDDNSYTNASKYYSNWTDIDQKYYPDKEYLGIPVEVNDGLKPNEMHKKIMELEYQIQNNHISMVLLENEKSEFQKTVKKLKKEKRK